MTHRIRKSTSTRTKKTIQSQHGEIHFFPGWTDFFSDSLQRKPFCIIVFKPANEALDPSLKDLAARQGLISFTKHKRPISSEDLEVLYVAYQLGLNTSEILANSAWFNTLLYFGKRGRENPREMKPGDRLLLVVYEFFSCSANIPRGLSAYNP